MKHIYLYKEFSLSETKQKLSEFLSDKKFTNAKSKMFIYHGTDESPDKFKLQDDYDGSKGHGWAGDLPEGYLFLSTDLDEASSYGKYVIPCELKKYDHIWFDVGVDYPSQAFDDDYGISVIQHTSKHFGFWEKFEESGKSVLIIKGTHKHWTVITSTSNVIARTDLAKSFYGL